MKRLVVTLALAVVLLVALAAPAGANTAVWHPCTVATFAAGDYGSFLEGMAADSHGILFGTLTTWGYVSEDGSVADSNIGEIWSVAPDGDKGLVATLDLSPNGMLLGIAVDRRDRVYVVSADFGEPQTVGSGVYRVDPDGSLVKVIALPAGSSPNGLAVRGDRAYITDSALGAVWSARVGDRVATPAAPWIQDALLAPGDPASDPTMMGLGANGIAFRGARVYVSVSDYGRIVCVPIHAGDTPGTPQVVCEVPELVTADGIAFDAPGGLWVTTNWGTTGGAPSGALYRLSPSGAVQQLADDPGWLNYPTMPVFGSTRATNHTLYIANGAYFDYEDGSAPDIQALPVGMPGLPLK